MLVMPDSLKQSLSAAEARDLWVCAINSRVETASWRTMVEGSYTLVTLPFAVEGILWCEA